MVEGDFWGGINIASIGVFKGDYIKVRNADEADSNITVQGTLKLTNSEIKNSYNKGINFNTLIQPELYCNTFINNAYGVYNSRTDITINAENNYWNSPYGPGYNRNAVNAGVDYDPWLGKEINILVHNGQSGVYVPTGNYSRTFTDMSLKAQGFKIDIARTYNSSLGRENGTFGNGWSFSYECRIGDSYAFAPLKKVQLPNGSILTFKVNDDGTFTPTNSWNTLVMNTDGYVLETKDQTKYTFNIGGFLEKVEDRNGNKVNILVDDNGKVQSISDNADQQINVTYTNGLITLISDYSGRSVTYNYDNGKLVESIDPMGNSTYYTYDTDGFLNGIKDTDTHFLDSVVYCHTSGENLDKVCQRTDVNGNVFTHTYDNINRKVTITDSNNRTSVHWYDSMFYTTIEQDAEGRNTTTEYYLDANNFNVYGQIKTVTDRNGNKTQYNYDSKGNITRITNPDNSYKDFTYDTKNNLLSEKDENGKFIYYKYDENGKNLVKKLQPYNGSDVYNEGVNDSLFAITAYAYYTDAEAAQEPYYEKGLLKSVTDPRGSQTTYEYDAYGNLTIMTEPLNKVTTNTFNAIGLLTGSISPSGYVSSFIYDMNGNLERHTLQNTVMKRVTYDDEGRKTKEVSANLYDSSLDDIANHSYTGDHGTRYTYYENGLLHTVTDAENRLISYTYDVYGNVLTETKPNDSITTYEYDVMNRPVKIWFKVDINATPILMEEFMYLILADKKTEIIDIKYLDGIKKIITRYKYDYAGRLLTQTNNDNSILSTAYNVNGTVSSTTDAANSITTYFYDGLNRLTEKRIPFELISGTTYYTKQKYAYDANGNMTQESITRNMLGQAEDYSVKDYTFDSLNQLVMFTENDNGSPENYTQYYYDAEGRKVRMYTGLSSPLSINGLDNVTPGTDTEYSVTKYAYNQIGKLTLLTDPSNNLEEYEYDLNGNMTEQTDRNGNVTTMTYDNLDRVLTKSVVCSDSSKNVSYTYTYNVNGNPGSITGGNTDVEYEYDQMGRVTNETESNGVVKEYGYDFGDNRTSFALYVDGVLKTDLGYTYDNMGRLYQVMENGTATATYGYDIKGNRLSLTYTNGNSTTYTYDLANKLKILTNKEGANNISRYNYIYSLDGNQVNKTDLLNVTTSYVYDDLGRITSEAVSGGTTTTYTYDDYNNRQSMLVTGGQNDISTVYVYDENNRLTSETRTEGGTSETTSYTYDNNGNQIAKGSSSYEYDGLNRLIEAVEDGQTLTYTYNWNDLRASKTVGTVTTTHIWDGQEMAGELDGSGVLTSRFIRGINLVAADDIGTNRKYYLYNGHGDVIQLNGTTGIVVKSYDYDAFGNEKNPDAADANPFRYCGEYFDRETGTIYLRARYYDPEIGRFISEDSNWGKDADPLSLNLYTYCGNDPIDRIDPSGNSWWDVVAGIAKAADDNFVGGLLGKASNGIKSIFGIQQNDWDYIKSTNEDFAYGYKAGSYTNAVYGVVTLTGGLKQIATKAGTVIVNESGEIVSVVSGTAQGVIKSLAGSGITIKSISNGSSVNGSSSPQYKKPISGSGKEKATDVPSWAKGNKPYTTENGKDFATRLMDQKYGKGNWDTSMREYSQIKKWGDRGFK